MIDHAALIPPHLLLAMLLVVCNLLTWSAGICIGLVASGLLQGLA